MNTAHDQQVASDLAAGRPTIASAYVAANKFAGFRHLLWKEYRSIRLFWISMLALTVAIQLLILAFSQDKNEAVLMIFHFALGAPAFFAVGAAGAAFAAEKEEGTFDFLRASPISAGQIVASKFFCVIISTIALFVVLWPIAYLLSSHQLPDATNLRGMLGLWLVGAVEAIAWGILFSLLGARPLVAVILAMVLATTCAHATARFFFEVPTDSFELDAYGRAALWRAGLALAVLMADVYLGLRWLEGGKIEQSMANAGGLRSAAGLTRGNACLSSANSSGSVVDQPDQTAEFRRLLLKRSGLAMLGRLFWQHWRQSWRLLLLTPALCLLAFMAIGAAGFAGILQRQMGVGIQLMTAISASLIGSMVFLTDQEQRRYRFFAEHNVPPRYIWLTRQLFWLVVILFVALVGACLWLSTKDLNDLARLLIYSTNDSSFWGHANYRGTFQWPPLGAGLLYIAVAYAAGQWVSMFVRSGIMSGFFGLLLSAVLCGWMTLIYRMQISPSWTVLPIPLVMMFTTWLRAPDWISENKRTGARLKAAAVVLLPAVAILIAVPIYRVHEVPIVSPGFDIEAFHRQIEADWQSGHETAELYRKAVDLSKSLGERPDFDHATPVELERWRQAIAEPLRLATEASNRPTLLFADPFIVKSMPEADNRNLLWLFTISAHDLQAQGKLDEALEQYFTALRIIDQASQTFGGLAGHWYSTWIFPNLSQWASLPGQTAERIHRALDRLQEADIHELHDDAELKSIYVITSRALAGDQAAIDLYYALSASMSVSFQKEHEAERLKLTNSLISSQTLWSTLLPWENNRAIRVLDQLNMAMLWRLKGTRQILETQGRRQFDFGQALQGVAIFEGWTAQSRYYPTYPGIPWEDGPDPRLRSWLATTSPSLSYVDEFGARAVSDTIDQAAHRRGEMIVMALMAYRLEHGKLPNSLAELHGAYLKRWLLDPYSGLEFRYFPDTVDPAFIPLREIGEESHLEQKQELVTRGNDSILPHQPGIWCTSPGLITRPNRPLNDRPADEVSDQANDETIKSPPQPTYASVWQQPLEFSDLNGVILSYGYWFPIPEAPSP